MSTPRSSVQLLLLFYVCATWPCIYCSLGSASRLCWLLVDCSSACVKVTWIQINGCGLWLQPWPRWVHDTLIDMQHIMICDYCNSNCFASKFKHIFNIRCGKYTPALLGREMYYLLSCVEAACSHAGLCWQFFFVLFCKLSSTGKMCQVRKRVQAGR